MSNTFIEIYKRLKSNLTGEQSIIEGTWTADNMQAVANELARVYSMEINPLLDKAFVQTAEGTALDRACGDYGVYRNEATYAAAIVRVSGAEGTYSGIRVAADDIVFGLDPFSIPASGSVNVRAVCSKAGSQGNVPAGAIAGVLDSMTAITAVENPLPAAGGYDTETDSSLRQRTLDRIRQPSTSGNIADYKKWALEVSGVEKAKVFPLARGAGTVDVVIIADKNSVAPTKLLESVSSHIELVRPIGADVSVTGAEAVEVSVSASIYLQDGYAQESVSVQFFQALKTHVQAISLKTQMISYLKIADLLFNCEGVTDIDNYTVNNQTESLLLAERQFPVAVMPIITVVGG